MRSADLTHIPAYLCHDYQSGACLSFYGKSARAHFLSTFSAPPTTILAIHKSREIAYSIQTLTAPSLPCFVSHMFRKASETAHAFSFYEIVNDTLVPSMFYLRLASSSFSTSQHLLSACLTVLLSAFYLSPLFFHYRFISCGPTFPFCLYCVFFVALELSWL